MFLQTVPFIFVLISRKTQIAYEAIFKFIDSNIFSLVGRSFMTDFEISMRNALRILYTNAHQYTCWFYFSQACKRQANKFEGFIIRRRNEKELRTIFAKFTCLPLLPPQDIKNGFDLLCLEAKAANA